MFKLLEGIIKDLKEQTTIGSDIVYLPSQLGVVTPMLHTLAKMKKQWKITFYESIDHRIINFEDQLKIKVKNEDFKHFLENVLHLTTLPLDSTVTLTQYLKEALDQNLRESYEELKEKILDMISVQPFVTSDINFEDWKGKFGVRNYFSSKDILLKFETFRINLGMLMSDLVEKIEDDKGTIDLLIETIESRGTLNKFPVFKDYKYLVGSIINSSFYDINLIYTTLVGMNYIIQENVQITNDDDLLAEIGGYRGLKTQGNQLIPIGGVFSSRFFSFLRDTIIDRV